MSKVGSADLTLRAKALVAKGEVLYAKRKSSPPNVIGGASVPNAEYAEWRSQSLTFLRNLGADTYAEEFDRLVQAAHPTCVEGGVGVLRAVAEDLEGGFVFRITELVAAEVFADFLEMARHLQDGGYHHAAASLAGAVMEDKLRRVAKAMGLKATGNIESLNDVLAEAKAYDRLKHQQVKVWAGIRNAADHGEFDRVEAGRVDAMLRDLPSFLASLG